MKDSEVIALCSSIENAAIALFGVIGGEKAYQWAVDKATNEPTANPGSEDENLYQKLFELAQCTHKIKGIRESSENMFYVPHIPKA